MVPNTDSAAELVRACFEMPCTLRGSALPHCSVGTCAAGAHTTGLLPDVVVSAGEVLRFSTAVGEVVSPSWSKDRMADAADVSAVVSVDIAAAAAAIGMAVVDGAVAAVAAQGASIAGDPVPAWLSVCRSDLSHGLNLQPRFGRRPHGQRLARGLRRTSSLGPTGSSPPEQSCLPGLSHQIHLSLHTNEPHRESEELGRPVLHVLSRGRVLSRDVSSVSPKSRAHERNIQRQAHLLLSRATRTFFSLCRRLLLVFRQQY